MANQKRSTIWVDAGGRTRQTILYGNATLAGVEAALLAVSNADVSQSWEATPTINAVPAPVNATYPNVADYAVLTYTDGAGSLVYITLPCPQVGNFMADGETVNPAAIAAVSLAVIGTVLSAAGAPVTAYVSGLRRRSGREYQ